MWVRADSSNGFISDLDVHTGKDGSGTANLGTKVVEWLSRVLVGGLYHHYFDNFSLSLFDSLLADGMYACGTFHDSVYRLYTGYCVIHLYHESLAVYQHEC